MIRFGIIAVIAVAGIVTEVWGDTNQKAVSWEWTDCGAYRVNVTVPPRPLQNRKLDQALASITLDVDQMAEVIPQGAFIDPASIQIVAYDSKGKAIRQNILPNAPYAVPHRWDDFDHRGTKFYYHRKGNCRNGPLTWIHTQRGNAASKYSIYFNTKQSLADTSIGPMHLIGDGDAIYDANGPLYGGLHLKVEVVDWDGDGLLDYLLGDTPGYFQFYRNTGTKTKPVFTESTFLDVDGQRFQQPYCPAFCAVDWDSDSDLDLIYGKEMGGEVYYIENTGTRKEPRLVSRGRLMCDGKPLQTPGKPYPDKPHPSDAWGGREYMCTPAAVDWDGDGDMDLLLGSYTGGWVYFCENIGKNADGTAILTWRGALKDANGVEVNAVFAASPEIADYDGDGDLDIVLGAADWTETAGAKPAADSTNLLYYENIGTRTKPALVKRTFPDKRKGKGIDCVAVPGAGDFDGDGDLDLIVGTFKNVVTYKNTGTPQKPEFTLEGPLVAGWNPFKFGGFASTPFDIDEDGDLDIIASVDGQFKVYRNLGGNPPKYEDAGYLHMGGNEYVYEFPYGDPELFSAVGDVDNDGRGDFLWGNGEGYVWYARNKGMEKGLVALDAPVRLSLANGEPVKIGHYQPNSKVNDFSTHSGDRSDPSVADFDADGDNDLLVSDAYGAITYFENIGSKNGHPVYAVGVQIKPEDNNRLLHEVVDWNHDGKPDLLFCRDDAQLWLNTGTGKIPSFTPGDSLLRGQSFPYAQAYAVDWNRDGDVDLLVANSYFILYYFERGYIDNGPAQGTVISVEKRGAN